jgi:hypothetical protein
MVVADEPHIRIHHHTDLTQVVDGELLDGILYATGQLPEGFEPFEIRIRLEFYAAGIGVECRRRLDAETEGRIRVSEPLVRLGDVVAAARRRATYVTKADLIMRRSRPNPPEVPHSTGPSFHPDQVM